MPSAASHPSSADVHPPARAGASAGPTGVPAPDGTADEGRTGRNRASSGRISAIPARISAIPARIRDGALVLAMVALAIALFMRRFADINATILFDNRYDQPLLEWMLDRTAHTVAELGNPFLAPELGVPHVGNLAANASVILPGIVLAPVTLLGGAPLSYVVLAVISLAGTAATWYFFLRRWVTDHRGAAFAGALCCGFAPGMVSQTIGHVHIACQVLVPVMLWVVLRLGEPGRTVRNGVLLGVVVAAQILTGAEVAFIAALSFGVFVACYAAARPAEVRARFRGGLASLALGVAVCLVLVGYPLYHQFAGPYAYHDLPNSIYSADLKSFTTYSTHSLAGDRAVAERVSPNPSEQSTFFGWPVLLAALVATGWLWRRAALRSAAVTGAAFGVLSLGPEITFAERPTGIPGPWALVSEVPVFRDIITVRLGLVMIPVIGMLIAASWATAAGGTATGHATPHAALVRYLWPAVLIAAALPAAPLPYQVTPRQPVPGFMTAGQWRACTDPGGTLVAYPTKWAYDNRIHQMTWQRLAGFDISLKDGYYLSRGPGGRGSWGQPQRSVDKVVYQVAERGTAPAVTPAMRERAREDLAYWRADCVAVGDQKHSALIRTTLDSLLGVPAQRGAGVWYWDVRR